MKISQVFSFCIIMLFYNLHNILSLKPDIDSNKIAIFGGLALLGLIIGLCFIARCFLTKKKLLYTRKQFGIVVLLIFFTIMSSAIFVIKGGSLKAIFMLTSCSGAIIVGLLIPLTNRRLSAALMLFILTFQLNVLLQGINSLIANNWWLPAFNVYFSSTNGTAQFAATSIAVVLLAYSQCEKEESFLQKIFIANIVVGTIIVFFSASRGGILALSFAAIYWLWKTTSIKALLLNKKTYKYILGVILLLLFIINTDTSIELQITAYFQSISKLQAEKFLDGSDRIAILKGAFEQVLANSTSLLVGQSKIFSPIPNTGHWHAHNSYVEMVRNLGVFPLLLMVMLLITAIVSNKSSPYIMAALIIIMIRAFFDDTLLWTNFGEFFLFWPVVLLTYRQYEKHSAN